jgi:hypothetical protein
MGGWDEINPFHHIIDRCRVFDSIFLADGRLCSFGAEKSRRRSGLLVEQ